MICEGCCDNVRDDSVPCSCPVEFVEYGLAELPWPDTAQEA